MTDKEKTTEKIQVSPPSSTQVSPSANNSEESWVWVAIVIAMCITLIYTTQVTVDAKLFSDMIQHYSLRGRDVLVEDGTLVFVND